MGEIKVMILDWLDASPESYSWRCERDTDAGQKVKRMTRHNSCTFYLYIVRSTQSPEISCKIGMAATGLSQRHL